MMGPCRLTADTGPKSKGICGADAWTIAARSTGTMLLTGCAAHCEHGRHIAHSLLELSEGKAPDYKITSPEKLKSVAAKVGIEIEGKSDLELAKEVAELALKDFELLPGRGECTWTTTMVTEGRKENTGLAILCLMESSQLWQTFLHKHMLDRIMTLLTLHSALCGPH